MEATRNSIPLKALHVLLAAALAVGLLVPSLAIAPAKAHAAQGATLTVGARIEYDDYNTTWFEVDGQPAWCGNPSKFTPEAGTYEKSPLDAYSGRTEELAADIWFSYGSPGFDASLWPSQWYGGGSMTPDRYMALAHILMADTYSSNGNYAMFGCSEGFRDWVQWNVIGFGDSGQLINDDATGRKILRRAGEVPSTFEPFMLYTGSSTQVILSFTYHTIVKVSKSASQSWAQDDPDYTLAGAVYGIYRSHADAQADRNRITTITTDASGAGESGSLGATRDTFYAKEVRASSGYVLDGNVYEVGPGNDYTFASAEPPITVRLALKKFDAETGHASPQGDATLDGALYQARYARGGTTETVKGETVGATVVFEGIPLGDIEVRELDPSGGYLLDRRAHRLRVTAENAQGGSAVIEVQPTREFGEDPQRGGFIVGKGDAERYEHEDGEFWNYAQGDATFEGAEFTVYNRSANPIWYDANHDGRFQATEEFAAGDAVMTIATTYNESLDAWTATTGARALPYGTYEVIETKAPVGYTREGVLSHVIEIREDGQFDQLVEADGMLNEVVRGGVQVEKDDLELGQSEALGGADHSALEEEGYLGSSLEGIEFTVVNASEHGVMIEDAYCPKGTVVAVIETAWNPEKGAYTAQTASDALPYGTYTIAETATNESYLLTDGAPRTFEVREDGKTVTCDREGEALLWRDQVVRHDAHLQKKGSILGSKLAHIPFLITNATTGEAHVAVIDRNGMLSTSSEWRSRQDEVNANDKLLEEDYIDTSDVVEGSGIWFGQGEDGSVAEPDDKLGAMPYGEYRIQELRCEANEGYALWEDTFNVSRDTTATGFDIDLGTVDDQPIPLLATEATDKADGDHGIKPEGNATVIDEVSYANLVPGKTYTVKGTLMDKATGRPLLVDGSEVASEKEFTPIAPFGYVKVEFAFDASALAGKEIVAFESLEHEGIEVAAHADIYDEGQTVKVEPNPEIGTIATDAVDGDHEVSADSSVRIEDQVFYTGLVPGESYTIKGTLMDKTAGNPVTVAGKPVEGEVRFSPEKENGVETVSFEFDGTGLEGKDIVIYEYLYREGELACEHVDIDNANQTVRMTEPVPEIGTTATDADDGDHEAEAGADVTIVDEVRYENLEPGREYVLTGTLIDKTTAKPVEKDGLPLTSVVTFTPAEPSGSVEVTFSFDGSELAGHRTVAFESLALDGEVVATHEDIHDEGQSVDIVEKPSPDIHKTKLAQTGDTNKIVPLVCLAVVAALAAAIALAHRKRGVEDKEEGQLEYDNEDASDD
ncbi:VaFE repeat-containing surface-anchored protein [Eggerthella lenta]|mgnify:CR=1 FL=1|uniref:VaFE repeat-containing surface-anchored protein n=2 Tax=Eggerthella TaxID=84111 RepID=UPI001F29F38C|nr:VaFE repeat-containing surface-anchored protein [Eggerthella lenta]MDU8005770.1 VaFE repeat-containing surface-anchored protein [Eggerthella sp.]